MKRPKFHSVKKDLRELKTNITNKEGIILRDFLAMERTTLANERTLLSTIRSSIYMTLAGIAFLNMSDFSGLEWVGYVVFGIAIILFIYGIYRYRVLKQKLSEHYEELLAQERKRVREVKAEKVKD